METKEVDFISPVQVGGRTTFYAKEITVLEALGNYTKIYLVDGSSFLTATTLGILEKRLKNFNFFRPNRSFLVNLDFMENYEKETSTLKMENTVSIRVSRRREKDFADSLKREKD